MANSIRKFCKTWWWRFPSILFFLGFFNVKNLAPHYDYETIKDIFIYPFGTFCQFLSVAMLFVGYQIRLKKPSSYSALKIPLILKAFCLCYFVSLVVYLPSIVSSTKDMLNYFRTNGFDVTVAKIFCKPNNSYFVIFSSIFLAPIFEEILCRFVIYQNFRNRYTSILLAMLVSSIIFSLYHLWVYEYSFSVYFNLFFMGCMFAYCYEKSGSIWTPIILHLLLNLSINITDCFTKHYYTLFTDILYLIATIVSIFTIREYLSAKRKLALEQGKQNEIIQTNSVPDTQE